MKISFGGLSPTQLGRVVKLRNLKELLLGCQWFKWMGRFGEGRKDIKFIYHLSFVIFHFSFGGRQLVSRNYGAWLARAVGASGSLLQRDMLSTEPHGLL